MPVFLSMTTVEAAITIRAIESALETATSNFEREHLQKALARIRAGMRRLADIQEKCEAEAG